MTDPEQPYVFANEAVPAPPAAETSVWKVMIVDDEEPVHRAMLLALEKYEFEGRPILLLNAYSANDARELLQRHPDTAVMFLDVVMEDRNAGLRFVEEMRAKLGYRLVRVILLTGQPDEVPEHAVVQPYDINDYKNKTELTQQRLFTTLTTTLRAYRDLRGVEFARATLEETVRRQMDDLREKNHRLEATLLQLKQLDEEKSTLLGIVAHDLKNPLSGMAGHLQLLLDEPNMTQPEREESLQTLMNGVSTMSSLVRRLLDAKAIECGELTAHPEPCDLVAICREVAKTYQLKTQAKKQTIALEELAHTSIALVDRALTHQVVDNLVSNAVKFSPPGRPIHVRVKDDPAGALRIEVEDEGPGVTADDHSRLFGKFTRLSAQSTAGEDSTGLGLSIVRKLVELMQGRVWCESEAGRGAIFVVQLPRPVFV